MMVVIFEREDAAHCSPDAHARYHMAFKRYTAPSVSLELKPDG